MEKEQPVLLVISSDGSNEAPHQQSSRSRGGSEGSQPGFQFGSGMGFISSSSFGSKAVAPLQPSSASVAQDYRMPFPTPQPSSAAASLGTLPDHSLVQTGDWMWMPLTALEYVQELDLEAEMAREVEDELAAAQQAWQLTIGEASAYRLSGLDAAPGRQSITSQLMSCFQSSYSDEKHGTELRRIAMQSGEVLHRGQFVDWYVRWLYGNDISTEDGSSVRSMGDLLANADEAAEAIGSYRVDTNASQFAHSLLLSPQQTKPSQAWQGSTLHPCEERHLAGKETRLPLRG